MINKKIYTVFIIEDEFPARKLLISYLENRSEFELSGIASSGKEAIDKLFNISPDLLLVDIHLPDLSGIEILERLKKNPYVIFTTAYDKYAVKAFDIGALDYLLKPISKDRFDNALDRFIKEKNKKKNIYDTLQHSAFSFKENREHYLIAYIDIVYFTSSGKHTVIHTIDRDFEISQLLGAIEEILPKEIFTRIHKRFMVNKHFISHLQYNAGGQYNLYLKDDEENVLPIGRSYLQYLKEDSKIVKLNE